MEGSTVPLSEEEQRQFEQLERALAAEDPKFVSAMRGTNVRLYYRRRAVLAGVGFVLGIAVLMTGAIIPNTIIGVIGFVMMGSAWKRWCALPKSVCHHVLFGFCTIHCESRRR